MNEDASRVEFIELIFRATDGFGFGERDEIEAALDSELGKIGMGYVSGAGAGLGVLDLCIEVDEQVRHEPQRVVAAVLSIVRTFEFPSGLYLLAYPTSLQHVDL